VAALLRAAATSPATAFLDVLARGDFASSTAGLCNGQALRAAVASARILCPEGGSLIDAWNDVRRSAPG